MYISQCSHGKEAQEWAEEEQQSLWQSHLMPISSSTHAGQWQLGSGFVAGAAAPVVSTQPHGQQVTSTRAWPQQDSSSHFEGLGEVNPTMPAWKLGCSAVTTAITGISFQ